VHDYSSKTRSYKGVSREQVQAAIDALTDHVGKQAAIIAKRYESGVINLPQFEIDMRALLKSGHIVAASVGKGGRARMTQSDWGALGNRIKSEYAYLGKFSRSIAAGRISKILTSRRAALYSAAIRITFHQQYAKEQKAIRDGEQEKVRRTLNAAESCIECVYYAGLGFIPLDEMPELGTLECGPFCRCHLEFENE